MTLAKAKHTPGPWSVGFGGSIVDANGKTLARVVVMLGRTDADDESNARLITAAPDLLAACEALLIADHDALWADQTKGEVRITMSTAVARIRAAIAKAKEATA